VYSVVQVYSRKFFLTKDIDIAIATLRATNTVSEKTNEKIGTSGTQRQVGQACVILPFAIWHACGHVPYKYVYGTLSI
jgi:hypothetical protein